MQQKQTDEIVHIRDGSPFWQFWHYEHGKRERISTKIPYRANTAAQAKLQKQTAMMVALKYRAGDPEVRTQLRPQTRTTVDTFSMYVEWWKKYRLPTLSPGSQERASQVLPRLAAAFGELPMIDITTERVAEWRVERLQTPAVIEIEGQLRRKVKLPKPQTVNYEVALLKIILKDAAEGGRLIDKNGQPMRVSPLLGMKNLKKDRVPAKKVLTPEQQARILDHLKDRPERYALVLLGIKTLARLTNLLGLQRTHYDPDSRIITYGMTKNGHSHTVWADDDLVAALQAIPNDGLYFFARCRTGERRYWNANIRQWFKAACKKAGVPYGREHGGITWHGATRRSSASRLLANGHNVFTVQQIGGWKDVRMVQEYQVPEGDVVKAALRSLNPINGSEEYPRSASHAEAEIREQSGQVIQSDPILKKRTENARN